MILFEMVLKARNILDSCSILVYLGKTALKTVNI